MNLQFPLEAFESVVVIFPSSLVGF